MNRSFIVRTALTALAILVTILSVYGQRPSKAELDLETLYIDGTRARLLGLDDEAIATFKKILDKDEDNDVVYFELAKIYMSMDEKIEALGAIKKAVAIQPKNVWYQEELAAAHAANDDFNAAAGVYKALISQRPEEQKFYYDLAFHHVKNNNIESAVSVFDMHEKKFGVSEEVIGRKFNLYRTLDNSGKAENELIKLTRAFPSEQSYAIGLAKFYTDTNKDSKAKAIYQQILKYDPTNVEAQVALNKLNGATSVDTPENIWANPDVNVDIKISKIIPSITGLSEASEERRQQVIDITKQITISHAGEAKAFAVHGDVLNFSNRPEEAIVAYEGALDLEKNIFSVWSQLLQLYKDQSQMKKLLDKSEMALDYFPNEASVYYMNGVAANGLAKHMDAISSLLQADIMTRSDQVMNASVKTEMGVAYLGLGKKDKAIDLLNEASAIVDKIKAPKSAYNIPELKGDILYYKGQVDDAVEQWKMSQAAGNPNSNLSKKISSRQI